MLHVHEKRKYRLYTHGAQNVRHRPIVLKALVHYQTLSYDSGTKHRLLGEQADFGFTVGQCPVYDEIQRLLHSYQAKHLVL